MAEEKLTWILAFGLEGDGLRQASAGVQDLQHQLSEGRSRFADFESAAGRARVSLHELDASARRSGGGLDMLRSGMASWRTEAQTLATVAGALATAATAGTLALNKFGTEALAAFGERASTLRAYTTLLGDAGQAEEEFRKAQQLSQRTDLTSAQTEDAQKSLMVYGFRDQKLDQALLTVIDAGAMARSGERGLTMERSARALGQILSKGRLQTQELNQLNEAGFSLPLIYNELIKKGFGKNAAEVGKAVEKGKVSADVAIPAIERARLVQLGTKKLGEYAVGSEGSVSGLESNRDEARANLLKSINGENLRGVQNYKDSLRDQSEALSLSTEHGKNLSLVLQDFASTSADLKAVWGEFTTGFVEGFSATYKALMDAFGYGNDEFATAGDAAKALGQEIGESVAPAVRALIRELGQLGPMIDEVTDAFHWLMSILPNFSKFKSGEGWAAMKDRSAKLLSGDWRGAIEDAPEEISYKERRDQARRERREKADRREAERGAKAFFSEGGVTYLGADDWPQWTMPIRRPGKAGAASASSAGASGGKGGGGGGGDVDYGLSYGGAPDITGYADALRADLAQSGASASAPGAESVPMQVVININGADKDPQEIAQEVIAELPRALGRFARTPSPGRL